jgi:hypothetical protein
MSKLTGKAFAAKMAEAKAKKHRESQRFPERSRGDHAGPQLEGKKMDHRRGNEPMSLDRATELVLAYTRPAKPKAEKKAAAAPAPDGKRQLERKRPAPPPEVKKGTLSQVTEAPE